MSVSVRSVTAVTAVTVQAQSTAQGTGETGWVTVPIGNRSAIGNRLTCEVTAVTAVTDAGRADSQGG